MGGGLEVKLYFLAVNPSVCSTMQALSMNPMYTSENYDFLFVTCNLFTIVMRILAVRGGPVEDIFYFEQ